MNCITIAIPYYEAPEMLRVHLKYWRQYPEPIASRVSIVLVDDGSPMHPAEEVLQSEELPKVRISLYRIEENIPWNHGGARNLAMYRSSRKEFIVSTDIDLVMPVLSMLALLKMPLDRNKIYIPARMYMNGEEQWKPGKRHKESFIMTREMFWRIGGFDEDFSGYWNGVFTPFRMAQKRVAENIMLDDVYLLNYADLVHDATVTEWGREESQFDIRLKPDLRKRQLRASRPRHYKPQKPLRFKWHRVTTYQQ